MNLIRHLHQIAVSRHDDHNVAVVGQSACDGIEGQSHVDELAGCDRQLVGTHYYSGIHDPEVNAEMYDLVSRRHDLIRQTGVVVTERTLHYHWEWPVDKDDVPPPWYDDAPKRTKARVRKYRAAREKGSGRATGLVVSKST